MCIKPSLDVKYFLHISNIYKFILLNQALLLNPFFSADMFGAHIFCFFILIQWCFCYYIVFSVTFFKRVPHTFYFILFYFTLFYFTFISNEKLLIVGSPKVGHLYEIIFYKVLYFLSLFLNSIWPRSLNLTPCGLVICKAWWG